MVKDLKYKLFWMGFVVCIVLNFMFGMAITFMLWDTGIDWLIILPLGMFGLIFFSIKITLLFIECQKLLAEECRKKKVEM